MPKKQGLPTQVAGFIVHPEVVAQIQFLEWTGADHLRHTKFLALRDDKDPLRVARET